MRMKCSDEWFVVKFCPIDGPVKRRPRFWQVVASVILLELSRLREIRTTAGASAGSRGGSGRAKGCSYLERVGRHFGRVCINAQIKPQVTGYLLRQTYQEGSFVKKGQLLFEIDPENLSGGPGSARRSAPMLKGQLAQAEANQVKAQLDVNRYTPLGQRAGGQPARPRQRRSRECRGPGASPGGQGSNRCGDGPDGLRLSSIWALPKSSPDRRHCRRRSSTDRGSRGANQFANDCVHA